MIRILTILLFGTFSFVACHHILYGVTSNGMCPANWLVGVNVDFCYLDTTQNLDITQAEGLCSTYNASMIMPKTTAEVDSIWQLLPHVDIYVGLWRNPTALTQWIWFDGTDHKAGQPSVNDPTHSNEKCIVLHSNVLNNRQCANTYRVVCQMDKLINHTDSTTVDYTTQQTTNAVDEMCICQYCMYNYTSEELQNKLEELKSENMVDKQTLSSTIRKLKSADDKRPSSRYVGILGIFMLASVGGLVIIPDLITLIKHACK